MSGRYSRKRKATGYGFTQRDRKGLRKGVLSKYIGWRPFKSKATQGRDYGTKNSISKWGRIYGGSLLPENLRTTFKFHSVWNDTTGAGFAQYAFRANSIYDPDVTLGGGKCIGVSAMANIYNRYRVIRSNIHLTVVNNDTDDPVHIAVVPQKSATALTLASKEAVPAQPGCSWDIVSNQTGKGTVYNFCNVASLSGTGSSNQETFTATFSNNPTTELYFIIYIYNESGNALNVEASVSISYDTVVSDIDYPNLTAA